MKKQIQKALTLVAACGALGMIGCAPPYIMTESAIYGDHYVRKMLKPIPTKDSDVDLSNYYVEICDVSGDGTPGDCNVTLVLENITNYTWKKY